ncbi:hypothetical protein QCB49_04245 [Cetobacterium somerae]|uniref:hypothetical protein n=1 Tax=Cetobacterium somerae TaxID=188913 RepID=UPI0038924FCA
MKISKKDALEWFSHLSSLSGDKTEVFKRFSPIIDSTVRQIELAVNKRHQEMKDEIADLKNLKGRTFFVGINKNSLKDVFLAYLVTVLVE